MRRDAQGVSGSGLRCTAPGMCPDGVQVRDVIGGMESLVAIGRFHKQGTDAPCLLMFVVSHAVEQLNRSTVVEDLASDLQMGSGCGRWARCRPDRRGIHCNHLSSFAPRKVQFWCHADDAHLPMPRPRLHSLRSSAVGAASGRRRRYCRLRGRSRPVSKCFVGELRGQMESNEWVRSCFSKRPC